eukprot:jgi/Undpi1/5285/HiC_scaffold_2.g00566.m1
MLHHCDTQNRKRRDRNLGLGSTTSKERLVNDARASHTFVPQTKAPQTWRVPDKKYTDELRQWTERNAGGAESCALGVVVGVGAGGVVATHADKGISVGLGEDGVGESATKEGKAVSPSAAGAGDTTAAADEMVADDTTAAADATVAATVAVALAAVSSFSQDERRIDKEGTVAMKKCMGRGAKKLPEDIPTSREPSSPFGRACTTAGE